MPKKHPISVLLAPEHYQFLKEQSYAKGLTMAALIKTLIASEKDRIQQQSLQLHHRQEARMYVG